VSETKPTLPELSSEPDRVPAGRLALIAAAALAIFAIGIAASAWMQSRRQPTLRPPLPAELLDKPGQPEAGIVDKTLFDAAAPATRRRQGDLDRLESYGWVDRDKKVVHIPIEVEMDRMALVEP
jgi:hypothetical protein